MEQKINWALKIRINKKEFNKIIKNIRKKKGLKIWKK